MLARVHNPQTRFPFAYMKVPFVGYKLQYQNLKNEIDSAMQDVLAR